jgi:hypothetical protein
VAAFVRLCAIVASTLVALGFLLFAIEQAGKGSQEQQAKIDDALVEPSPTPRQEFLRERENGDIREAIDDANDVLLAPFADLVGGNDDWMLRVIPALLALLVYGGGGLLLANFLPKPRREVGDWREAT